MDLSQYQANAGLSAPGAPVAPSAGFPVNGNPVGPVNPTEPGAYWFYQLQEEIRNLIEDEAGLTPDHESLTQLADAIKALINNQTGTEQTGFNMLAPHQNLVVTENAGTPNSQVDIDADAVLLRNGSGSVYRATTVNLTANIAAAGFNGLDTGSEAASTWYWLWVIYNPTTDTVSSLLSQSNSAPTMPADYEYKGLVGAVFNDGSSNFLPFRQAGTHTRLKTRILEVNDTSDHTTAVTPSLTVPPLTTAIINAKPHETSAGGPYYELITSLYETDSVPSSSVYTFVVNGANNSHPSDELRIPVNASSQIRYRSSQSSLDIQISTIGWEY